MEFKEGDHFRKVLSKRSFCFQNSDKMSIIIGTGKEAIEVADIEDFHRCLLEIHSYSRVFQVALFIF